MNIVSTMKNRKIKPGQTRRVIYLGEHGERLADKVELDLEDLGGELRQLAQRRVGAVGHVVEAVGRRRGRRAGVPHGVAHVRHVDRVHVHVLVPQQPQRLAQMSINGAQDQPWCYRRERERESRVKRAEFHCIVGWEVGVPEAIRTPF